MNQQVPIEGRGDIEGRRREREEDARNDAEPPAVQQRVENNNQPQWRIFSSVEAVLLNGRAHPENVSVNDFLRRNLLDDIDLDQRLLRASMFAFVQRCEEYINDVNALNRIFATTEYKVYKRFVSVYGFFEDEGILNLQRWQQADEVVKAGLQVNIRGQRDGERLWIVVTNMLNDALDEARERAAQTAGGAVEIKGVYESIYNATWGYVESGYDEEPLGMKVFDGRPPHMWTKEEVDVSHTPETMNEPLPRHGNLEIAVLTSQMGWPYTSFEKNPNDYDINHKKGVEYVFKSDVYIRREALRVWYKVENVLNRWLMDEVIVDDASNVLIGTPGIGKSFSVGSLLLYKLLHYEASQLQIIIYVVEGEAYVFRKPKGDRAGYVTFYSNYKSAFTAVKQIIGESSGGEDIKGYLIFDVDKDHHAPVKPPAGCAGIALSSPNVKQFHEWSKQNTASDIYMNCDTLKDLEAIHISRWGKIAPAYKWSPPVAKEKIESEWQEIQARIRIVGPLLRHIGRLSSYNRQEGKVQEAIGKMKDDDMNDYAKYFQNAAMWQTDEVSHKLVGVVRVKEEKLLCEMYRCRPLSSYTGQAILDFLIPWLTDKYAAMSALLSNRALAAYMFEKSGIEALSHENTLTELARELQGLSFARNQIPQSVLQVLQEPRLIGPSIVVPEDVPIVAGAEIQYMKLYKPQSRSFPVVDAFFFVESPKTFVGLQYTVSGRHPCSTGGLFKMKRYLRSYFQGWDNFSNDMVWEIIYVQRVDSEKITKPQCCERTDRDEGQNNEVEERFWKREVRQFAVSLYKHIIALYVELKTRGENNNGVNNRGGNNA